jgi:hypothetical protein
MAVPDDSFTVTWGARGLRLDELAEFTSLLVDLHGVAVPYITSEFDQAGPNVAAPTSLLVASLSLDSPLVVQLLVTDNQILVGGLMGVLLNKPERLAEILPGTEAWYRRKGRALEAKIEYTRARGRLVAQGRCIATFEREYPSRSRPGRETRNRRDRDDRGRGGRAAR